MAARALLRLPEAELARRAAGLEWLLLDVDGVLTDGRLYYHANGETLKTFHVRDGFALKLARTAGLKTGLLTARNHPAISRRAEDLGMDTVMLGIRDKAVELDAFLARERTSADRLAYAGDDLPDLPVLRRVALAFAPADAAPEVVDAAHVVLSRSGGDGAVREMIELVLGWRGDWARLIAPHLS